MTSLSSLIGKHKTFLQTKSVFSDPESTMHRPCLEACLLVAPLVKQVVFVHVVHVDELAGVDDVAHYPGVQGQPHLTLLNTEHSLIVISDNTSPTSVLPSGNVFPSKTFATSSLFFLSTRNKEHRSACKHHILRFSNR